MPYKDPEQRRICRRRNYWKNVEQSRAKQRVNNKRHYYKDPEKSRAKSTLWHQENALMLRQTRHANYMEHPEEYRKRSRDYRNAHIEERRAYNKDYSKKRPEKAALHGGKRKARKQSLPDTFTPQQQQFMMQYWHFSCAICGNQNGFQWTLALDHFIPLSSPECPGTIAENILPLCHGIGGCNNSKKNRDAVTWLQQRYGMRKANMILKAIHAYFTLVKSMALAS